MNIYDLFVAGTFPVSMFSLSSLQNLVLNNNALYGSVVNGLFSELITSQFSVGTIPSVVGLLTKLSYFNIFHNNLNGIKTVAN